MKKTRTIIWVMIVLVSFVLLIPKNSLEVNACEGQTQNNLSSYVYSAPISPLIPTKSIVGQSRNFTNSPMLARSLKPGDEESRETIYAPDGTSITAYHYYDYEDDEVRKAAQRYVEEDLEFTELEVEELPTWRYNCHAFAWYNDSVWIHFAEPFVADDYTSHPISPQDVQIGDIVTYLEVTYGDNNEVVSLDLCLHSAVVEEIESDGTIVCKSKWAQWGLYIHDIDYVPIDYYNIEYTNTTKTYDLCCFFLRQNDHLMNYNTISNNQHYIECSVDSCNYYNILHDTTITSVNDNQHKLGCNDCEYSVYENHDTTITSVNDSQHRLGCNDCDYYVYEDHDIYISEVYNHVYTIKCRGCTYEINCNCDREYEADGDIGHYVECMDGCFSEFESHTYELTGAYNSSGHEIECIYCYYSEYVDHDLYMYSAETEDYTVKCRDCNYSVRCVESPEYYGDSDDGHWVSCPDGCYSFYEPHTPDSYEDIGESTHEVVCADCGYTYYEDHNYGDCYHTASANYHYYECVDCGYTYAETHTLRRVTSGDLYTHIVECTVCDYDSTESHTWVSYGTGYRCSVCKMLSDSPPIIMSLPDPELEAYLASLSDEELEEFIASLPEDQVERVTALLPSDDEHLTE